MSLTWAAGATLVALCWSSGTLLTVVGRRRAAVLFAGDSPGFGQTVRAQLTGTTLNRVIPANGGLVTTHLQLLRRHGVPSTALTATLLGYAASHVLAHMAVGAVVLVAVAGDLVPNGPQPALPAPGWWALLVLALLPLLALRVVRRALRSGGRHLLEALRLTSSRPGAVAALALFEIGTLGMLGLGLFVALRSSGATLSLPMTVCVLVLCNVLAGAVPAPAGVGPVDVALVAGLTGVGVTAAAAVAAVGMYRLVTHWLPVPLGLLAIARPAGDAAGRRRYSSRSGNRVRT